MKFNIKRTLIILFFINIFCQKVLSQVEKDSSCYEQIALDYFIDSLLPVNYPTINQIYFHTKINPRLTLLRPPIGFVDYRAIKDSQEISNILKRQSEIRSHNLGDIQLHFQSVYKEKIIQPLPPITDKIDWARSISIEVFRISTVKIGYYIDEIIVRNKTSRTYFYLEFNKEKKMVCRWYKVMYVI